MVTGHVADCRPQHALSAPLDGARLQGITSDQCHHTAYCLLQRIMEYINLFNFRNVCWCCIMITTTQTSRGPLSGKKARDISVSNEQSLERLKRHYSQFSVHNKELVVSCLFGKHFLFLAQGQLFPEATGSFSSEGMSRWRKVGNPPFSSSALLTFTLSLSLCLLFLTQLTCLYSAAVVQVLRYSAEEECSNTTLNIKYHMTYIYYNTPLQVKVLLCYFY